MKKILLTLSITLMSLNCFSNDFDTLKELASRKSSLEETISYYKQANDLSDRDQEEYARARTSLTEVKAELATLEENLTLDNLNAFETEACHKLADVAQRRDAYQGAAQRYGNDQDNLMADLNLEYNDITALVNFIRTKIEELGGGDDLTSVLQYLQTPMKILEGEILANLLSEKLQKIQDDEHEQFMALVAQLVWVAHNSFQAQKDTNQVSKLKSFKYYLQNAISKLAPRRAYAYRR